MVLSPDGKYLCVQGRLHVPSHEVSDNKLFIKARSRRSQQGTISISPDSRESASAPSRGFENDGYHATMTECPCLRCRCRAACRWILRAGLGRIFSPGYLQLRLDPNAALGKTKIGRMPFTNAVTARRGAWLSRGIKKNCSAGSLGRRQVTKQVMDRDPRPMRAKCDKLLASQPRPPKNAHRWAQGRSAMAPQR